MFNKPPRVLLVEDDLIAKQAGIFTLEQLGCETDAVLNGKLALEHAKKIAYDIIFMDIGLPDINGLKVIAQLRTLPTPNQKTPIIALTAHFDKKYMAESFQAGANDYLVKPLDCVNGKNLLVKYLHI